MDRGELGDVEADIPGTHYAVRGGDRLALIDHRNRRQEQIENGACGQVLDMSESGEVLIQFDATGQFRSA